MKFPLFGAPKWKHPDLQVRTEAVGQTNDEDVLVEVAQTDTDPGLRAAAVARIQNEELLAWIAIGESDMCLSALARVTTQKQLAHVAKTAASREVRLEAVNRLEDTIMLQRIAAQETDPTIRTRARLRASGDDDFRRFLRTVLSGLPVEQSKPASNARDLNSVCAALASDPRFRVHGVIGELDHGRRELSVIELLGNKSGAVESDDAFTLSSYFHIEVKRTGRDAFDLSVEERELARQVGSLTGGFSISTRS